MSTTNLIIPKYVEVISNSVSLAHVIGDKTNFKLNCFTIEEIKGFSQRFSFYKYGRGKLTYFGSPSTKDIKCEEKDRFYFFLSGQGFLYYHSVLQTSEKVDKFILNILATRSSDLHLIGEGAYSGLNFNYHVGPYYTYEVIPFSHFNKYLVNADVVSYKIPLDLRVKPKKRRDTVVLNSNGHLYLLYKSRDILTYVLCKEDTFEPIKTVFPKKRGYVQESRYTKYYFIQSNDDVQYITCNLSNKRISLYGTVYNNELFYTSGSGLQLFLKINKEVLSV